MSRAERRVALPPKVYKMEGIAPAGMRKKEGVRSESESSSMRAEVRRGAGKSGASLPRGPLSIKILALSNLFQRDAPTSQRLKEIRDWVCVSAL